MAAVDSLLRLITIRSAELLVIASGQVPVLRKSGEAAPLSMPPLDPPLVASLVEEVLDEGARERLGTTGAAETTYRLDDGSAFALRIERAERGFRMTCRLAPPAAAPRAAATTNVALPPPVATPAPRPELHVVATPLPAAAPAAADVAGGLLAELLDEIDRLDASDLLLSAGQRPRLRVGGELIALDAAPLDDAALLALVAPALDARRHADLERAGSADAALAVTRPGGVRRYRLNLFRQHGGLAIALRPIRAEAPTLEALHLPSDLHELTRGTSGLVLVTGRAGSGKSTTLVALIEHLNRTRARHVITLEDPIEHAYRPGRCLIHQREVGVHVESFAAGLRAALRESPDVILVGELRDRETIAAALTAAETGHLVLATLHCAGTVAAIDRIVDVFPEAQQEQVRVQLAATLRAVLAQVLVPTETPPMRLPAYERLVVTNAVAAQIRDGKLHQLASLIQTGRDAGMVPLERTLAALVRSHRVRRDVARDAALDPAAFDELVR